jgi:hypothetical protein
MNKFTFHFKKKDPKTRQPSQAGQLVTVTGAVIVHTAEGTIVVTPKLARELAQHLPLAATKAEQAVLNVN